MDSTRAQAPTDTTPTPWQKGLTARQVLRVARAVGQEHPTRNMSRAAYTAALRAKREELYG